MNLSSILKKINIAFLLLTGTALTLSSCHTKKKWLSVDPAYSKYIDAYTSGVISKTASIKIQLADDVSTTHAVGDVVDNSLFDFSPSVKGKATWIDARTIEFKPEKNLDADQLYEVSFKLGDVTKVPADFATFNFNVQTLKPAFKVTDWGMRSTGAKDKMILLGQIETADIESSATVEQLLAATQNDQPLKISWQHNENTKLHNFTVEGITRGSSASQVSLSWNGKPLNVTIADKKDFEVPAVGDFKVMNIIAMNDTQQYASVQFSDPIAVGQELTGLLGISDQSDITYTINGSEVKIYTGDKLDGNYTVNVNTGIKNIGGSALGQAFTASVFFENRMPSVKIEGRGNILPNSGKLMLPFESINLNAVDISIIQIYENDIPQFLQTNDLSGDDDLRRVAKPIVEKTLRLDDDKTLDLHKKQHFSLDIDKFLKTQPGAIYRIVIGFRPEYSLYTCHTANSTAGAKVSDGDEDDGSYGGDAGRNGLDDQDDFWNRYSNFYPYGYDWEHKDDPCYGSYYNKDKWAVRNILASNIGLTAKRGANNSFQVAVSDIISTEPMADVDLEVLDYQQQVIGKAKSDNNGFATFDLKEKPFLLVAQKATEKGYLKLDDESTLPLSRFDVGGDEVVNGIKGFIFGERGVWRPGDSLYINCIIQDKENKLPSDIPVDFSLYNPTGQLYKHIIQHNANDGFNVFRTNTDQTAPTGNWQVKIKVGGATFEKTIKIETIMPNRLKIDLNFGDSMLDRNAPTTGTLSSKWLFGTPAKNLKARIDVSLNATTTKFKGFDGFSFDNPTGTYSTQSKTMFDGTLDADGNATVKPDFAIDDNAPGMLNANMLVKVFEPGGAFSIDNVTLPYSPYSSYVGIKLPEGDKTWGFLLTDQTHTAEIVDVDSKGKLVQGNTDIEVQFYKIQWRWWWDNSGESLSNFTQDQYNKLIKEETLELRDGKCSWDFRVDANQWGRYLVLVKDLRSGHTTGQVLYIDSPGWQSRDNTDDPTAASMLSFTSDKQKYNVGDQVTLTIPSSKGGRGLISIESGTKIVKTFWVETTQGQTIVKFTADKNMSPNVYINVSLLQPHAQTLNDLPIRMYGVIPIFVEDKNTILNPVINMPSTIRPEQQSSITVSEKNGKAMTYCIAIVDDGLLDLTRFKTPDPHSYFYAREALGVKSWDLYDYVIGAWGGDLDRILTIGGDQDAGPAKQKKANRFKPVVKYLGPFHLDEGESQTHNFTLPQYIGSVRAMVVAANNGSYGNAEKTVAVKKPLMILATMPRVLGPTESIKLPVTVFAMEKNVKNVTVTLQSNPFLEVVGASSQTVSFTEIGEQQVYFDVNVKQNIGIGKVKVTATSGDEKADCDIELDIRNPNPPVTSVSEKLLSPNEQWNTVAAPIGVAVTSKATLEISSIPPMNLEKRLDYLIEYPYGCIEQTTSSVFPQLVLNQLTDLDDYRKSLVDRNIKSGISRIQNFQCTDGGFSYWPGEDESDEWGTNYAGHFLLEAKARGYTLSDVMMQQWKAFQRNKANEWAPSTTNFYGGDLTQSYRLFLLALAKAPELGAMNRLKEFKYLSPEAKWRLAAAYKLVGQDNVALNLISGLPTTFTKRTSPGFTYGSDVRDQAMVLETLTLLGRRTQAAELVSTIAAKLSQDNWYSTQTTAYSLIAIAEYCGKNPSGAKIIANENINGKTVAINSSSYFSQTSIDVKSGNANIIITNKGNNNLYVRLITQGQPLAGSDLHVRNNPAVLAMNVSYITQNGNPIDINSLTQGTDLIAKVTIKNTGNRDYTQMALSQIFPSGWEILNTRMMDGEGSFQSSPSDYQDIRDDRIYTYFDIDEGKTLTYYVQLNAAYLGKYFLPGTFCEAMYDNSITAGVNGKWVDVVAQ